MSKISNLRWTIFLKQYNISFYQTLMPHKDVWNIWQLYCKNQRENGLFYLEKKNVKIDTLSNILNEHNLLILGVYS